MQIAVVGATGFIGRALVLALQGHGHAVCALVRSRARAAAVLPAGIEIVELTDDGAVDAAIARAEVVVNLAGESIAGKRWTRRRKQVLRASRLDVTQRLVDATDARKRPLPLFVSASAVGIYGDGGEHFLDEASPPGEGFAAELCQSWEAVAKHAHATRIVCMRFGIVLGRDGGALEPLLRVGRLGLGGPLAGGEQWVSWIHLDDLVAAVLHVLETRQLSGPLAVVSPEPVRQRELARAIGEAVHRPAVLPAPRFALSLVLGEAADLLLQSQRVLPRALGASGFQHRFPTLESALSDLLSDAVTIRRVDQAELPDSSYVQERRPRYTLSTRTELDAPLAEVFPFFAAPANLGALTPRTLSFEILGDPGAVHEGALIDYRIRLGGLPMRWRTQIRSWLPGKHFVDSQERGPYRAWWHEHRFHERDGKTIMDDVVHYAPPLGPLGAIAHVLFVGRMLRRIFNYRQAAIRLRFYRRLLPAAELSSQPRA